MTNAELPIAEEQTNKSNFYKKRSAYLIGLVGVLILAAVALGLFQWHQSDFAISCIQGYWLIADNIFLLIDDTVVRVFKIEFSDAQKKSNMIDLFVDDKSKITYDSILPTDVHQFTVVRSNEAEVKQKHNICTLFNSKKLVLELTPALGLCTIKDSSSDSSIICYKDPVMTLDYFKK